VLQLRELRNIQTATNCRRATSLRSKKNEMFCNFPHYVTRPWRHMVNLQVKNNSVLAIFSGIEFLQTLSWQINLIESTTFLNFGIDEKSLHSNDLPLLDSDQRSASAMAAKKLRRVVLLLWYMFTIRLTYCFSIVCIEYH